MLGEGNALVTLRTMIDHCATLFNIDCRPKAFFQDTQKKRKTCMRKKNVQVKSNTHKK